MLAQALTFAAALVLLPSSTVSGQHRPTEIVHTQPWPVSHDGFRRCAAFDLHLLWLIEDHAEAEEISTDEITGAAFRLVEARRWCASGRFAEALEVYSTIALAHPRSRWFR